VRFSVEPWAPEYGAGVDAKALTPTSATVEVGVEVRADRWAPLDVRAAAARRVLVVDGVRRVDAQVWIAGRDRAVALGLCATYAAGVVCCDGAARVLAVEVRRGLCTAAGDVEAIATPHATYEPLPVAGETAEELAAGLQQRMRELEAAVAGAADDAELVVVDGPLARADRVANAVGFVKTHRVGYLPPVVNDVVADLAPGQRTPLFLTTGAWSRFSAYLRLPGPVAHPWAGVVRLEVSGDLSPRAAGALVDRAAVTLPAFASAPHKDPRAPQNLYPIGGLERALRRRLGDPALLYRAIRSAAGRG
jgi:hypothetical protein